MKFEDEPRRIIFEPHEQALFKCPNPLELNDDKLLILESVVMQATAEIRACDQLGKIESLHKKQAQRKAIITKISQELDILTFRDQLDALE